LPGKLATKEAAQKAAQQTPVLHRKALHQETQNPRFSEECEGLRRCTNRGVEVRGLEPLTCSLRIKKRKARITLKSTIRVSEISVNRAL
jgi:hypothetical protein